MDSVALLTSGQEERDSPIFWGDNQGPVVMVWDVMLPGEQESAKKIITDEKDWNGSNPVRCLGKASGNGSAIPGDY